MIDIAKSHTTKKKHVDVGLRVCDYPTIQDYVGEAIIDTNACRLMDYSMAQAMDAATNDCDWSIHKAIQRPAARAVSALALAGEIRRGQERRPCRG
jgi:alkylation response protein AidB-like acyl-CoA dehydrogenase